MRYLALVADYDGVIASDGAASPAAIAALKRLRLSGRRAILITGRRLAHLQESCPDLSPFDYVVAENGAVAYEPRTREETLLAQPLPPEFIERLRQEGVEPLEIGKIIVATRVPHHLTVLKVIHELGLELHIIFNQSAVMVVPGGINKASGMEYALRKLGLSRHEVVGIGDSENDHSFLRRCECPVTVANALPSIKKMVAFVTKGANGDGVAELVDELIATDLSRMEGRLQQNLLAIGRKPDGTPVNISPYGRNILIAGPSGSGKSTATAGIVERLRQMAYQLCIVDPEGDYGMLQDVITLGNQQHAVTVNEVLTIIEDPKISLNVNLLGIPLSDRPRFFCELFPGLQAMRTRTGRPHWIVLDEAHHMMPAEWSPVEQAMPASVGETIFVTVHPDHLSSLVLEKIETVMAVGPSPDLTMAAFARATGRTLDWPTDIVHQDGTAVVWLGDSEPPFQVQVIAGRAERIRHHRKYAEGNLHYHSFYFRGPHSRHNLKAQNLTVFAQIADGIDEETWLFHLRRGDYSRWFRKAVRDDYLADQAEQIERRQDLKSHDTRRLIRRLIEARYTLPE